MTKAIVLTGAGSGGHITPLLAVADELKRQQPDWRIIYVGQRGDKIAQLVRDSSSLDEIYSVRAGKFRRYHGEGWRQWLDLPTLFFNARDFLYVLMGLVQSWRLLKKLQPDLIFIKGGFVGVPIGLAAASRHIPYITHDSDAIPGLANRLVARWASWHAVALPKDIYSYPANKTITTGIPLQSGFKPVDEKLKQTYRRQLKLPKEARVLFVIGGGLGSQTINQAMAQAVPHLMNEFLDLRIVHVVGAKNIESMKQAYSQQLTDKQQLRLEVIGFLNDVFRYSGAADVIVTRAGATNLAEFALQGKACVVVPSGFLAGGHQLKNAQALAERQAIVVIDEEQLRADANRLARRLSQLIKDPARQTQLGQNIARLSQPKATQDLVKLIIKEAETSVKK